MGAAARPQPHARQRTFVTGAGTEAKSFSGPSDNAVETFHPGRRSVAARYGRFLEDQRRTHVHRWQIKMGWAVALLALAP
jgi:hypothetical protein